MRKLKLALTLLAAPWVANQLLRAGRAAAEHYSYVTNDGYLFNFDNLGDLEQAIEADMRDERRGQVMPDFDNHVWVLNLDGMREIFSIIRNEPDDEVALLTISANTRWAIPPEAEE